MRSSVSLIQDPSKSQVDGVGDDSGSAGSLEVPEEEDMSEATVSMVQIPGSRLDLEEDDDNTIDLR